MKTTRAMLPGVTVVEEPSSRHAQRPPIRAAWHLPGVVTMLLLAAATPSTAQQSGTTAGAASAPPTQTDTQKPTPAPPAQPDTQKPASASNVATQLSTPFARLLFGFDRAGASSASPADNLLVDLALQLPFPGKGSPGKEKPRRGAAWFNARITGVPKTASPQNVQAFINSLGGSSASTLNEVVQGGEITGGLDLVVTPHRWKPFSDAYECELALVFGIGMKTPFDPKVVTPVFVAVYDENKPYDAKANPNVEGLSGYPGVEGKKYIAFTPATRNRFYRQYFFGIRFKTHQLLEDNREAGYPGVTELTFGADEAITDSLSMAKKAVVHFSANYPVPIQAFHSALYLFGGLCARITRKAQQQPTVVLKVPSATVVLPSMDVAMVTTDAWADRDTWKFGVGIDLIALANALRSK